MTDRPIPTVPVVLSPGLKGSSDAHLRNFGEMAAQINRLFHEIAQNDPAATMRATPVPATATSRR